MKMKKLMCVLTGICLASFVAGLAMAEGTPSAKFAATWSEDITLGSVADTGNVTAGTSIIIDDDAGVTLTKIKVPQDKELLVGVSAEIGILTDTSIRGKNGGNAKALAGGAAWVTIVAEPVNGGDDVEAEPGTVILSGRIQELEATLGGVIESCPVTCNEEWDNGVVVDVNCEDIVVAEDCVVTDEEIAYYSRRSKGVGMVVTACAYVTPNGKGFHDEFGSIINTAIVLLVYPSGGFA